MRGFIPPVNDDERLFVKRTADLAAAAARRGFPCFSAFCSDREQVLARAALAKAQCEHFRFFGGYEGAERQMLCVWADAEPELFPIRTLWIEVPFGADALTHRDYLGSLMGLGLKRECMGDILVRENGAYLLITQQMAPFVLQQLCSVGRAGASVREAELPAQLQQREVQTATVTVPSLRLDALLAAMMKTSRSDAAELIRSGAVLVNHVPTDSAHYEVCEGDLFTVRGKGRYRLCEVRGKSKKDRTFVSYEQY